MAGRGSRFADAGYELPKPLIKMHGQPMIRYVISNLRPNLPYRFIFLCLSENIIKYCVDQLLRDWEPTCEIVAVDNVTEGAACTVLLAKRFINSDDSLMIANSDQYIDLNINDYLDMLNTRHLDGLIMTMTASHPKWSFAAVDAAGRVIQVAEKEPISNEATVGIYNFTRGADYVRSAK